MGDLTHIGMSNRNIVMMLVVLMGFVYTLKTAMNKSVQQNAHIILGMGTEVSNFDPSPDYRGKWIVSTSGYIEQLTIFRTIATNSMGIAFAGFSKLPLAPGTQVVFLELRHTPSVALGKSSVYIVAQATK